MLSAIPTTLTIFRDGEPTRVRVEWRDTDRYAVITQGRCLSRSGKWDFEPLPSSRTDRWNEQHRFDLGEALELATKHAEVFANA